MAGATALAGLQLATRTGSLWRGCVGALAIAWSHAFIALTVRQPLYLGWLGLQAWR